MDRTLSGVLTDGKLTVISVLPNIRFKVAFFLLGDYLYTYYHLEIMAFFCSALNASGRKWVVPSRSRYDYPVLLGYVVLSYFIILNTAIGWMIGQSQEFVEPLMRQAITSTLLRFEDWLWCCVPASLWLSST